MNDPEEPTGKPSPRSGRRMSRRANGEGTVYQRADGRWEGAGYVLHADGIRRRVHVYGSTRKQAQDKLDALLADNAKGLPLAVDRTITVAAYLQWWLTTIAVHRLRPTTYVTYQNYIDNHLIPGLGQRKLSALTPKQVRTWLNTLAQTCQCCAHHRDTQRRCCAIGQCCRRFHKPATVAYLRAILSSALAHSVRDDELPRNVAAHVRLGPLRTAGCQPLTAAEARHMLTAAAGNRYHALFELALRTGLRRGELLGLRWADLNLDQATLDVRQTVQRDRTGRLIVMPTKSTSSDRRLAIPRDTIATLAAHHARQTQARATAGDAWRDTGLVFANTLGGPLDPSTINRNLHKICDTAHIRRIRFHDLRHSCATLLLEQGVELVVIKDLLGHARISITADLYAHVRLRLQRQAIEAMGDALEQPTGEHGDQADDDQPPNAA
jgi:integrase